MANSNPYNPTAANIISSLGIKGATEKGGAGKAGNVPVLDDSGLIDISLIPVDKIAAEIHIPPLANTAYVDPKAGTGVVGYTPNGSIATPYRTLKEAASAGYSNFILASDKSANYGDDSPIFNTQENIIRIFSTGGAQFNKLNLYGYKTGTTFILNNISVSTYLTFNGLNSCSVRLTGPGSIGTIQGAVDDRYDDVSRHYLTKVEMDADFRVSTFVSVKSIAYVGTSAQISNASTVVAGKTVAEATDNLGKRRIRIPQFSKDAEGIHADGKKDVEITDGSSYDYHDIVELGQTLVEAANGTFYKKNDSPVFKTVKAETIKSDTVETTEIATTNVKFGNLSLYVDDEDFLVLGDIDSSDSHVYPRYDDADYTEYPRTAGSSDSDSND